VPDPWAMPDVPSPAAPAINPGESSVGLAESLARHGPRLMTVIRGSPDATELPDAGESPMA